MRACQKMCVGNVFCGEPTRQLGGKASNTLEEKTWKKKWLMKCSARIEYHRANNIFLINKDLYTSNLSTSPPPPPQVLVPLDQLLAYRPLTHYNTPPHSIPISSYSFLLTLACPLPCNWTKCGRTDERHLRLQPLSPLLNLPRDVLLRGPPNRQQQPRCCR